MTTDRIELTGIRAVGTIGLLPEEQARPQPFEVDLVIEVDTSGAGRTDDLTLSVDYGVAIELAVRVIEREATLLLERVAARITEEILGLDRVEAVEVVVRKLRPPVPFDITSTAVHIRRTRSSPSPSTAPGATASVPSPSVGRATTTAYVAIGSNLGDRRGLLRYAVDALPDVLAVSGVYETDPVGGPEQGPYLNMVVELATTAYPFELLDICQAIEAGAGRERLVRWGARTLDLDVLLWGDAVIESERLTVPHPRMWERRFVLQPLHDLAPDLVPEGWELLPEGGIVRVADLDA